MSWDFSALYAKIPLDLLMHNILDLFENYAGTGFTLKYTVNKDFFYLENA